MGKRPYRPQQKGVECKIPICTNWCVCNDLCAKHNQALYRYGNPLGKKPIKKICKNKKCRKRFSNKRDNAEYCSPECYNRSDENKKKSRERLRKWRKERTNSLK